ncbi:MAG: hypothetical protein ACI4FZ_07625 [Lachnospiraceae bacterium]
MQIIGKKTFLGKDKETWRYILNIIVPMSDRNIKAGGIGFDTTESVFVSREYWEKVKEEDLFRDVVFDYAANSFGKPEPCGHRFMDAPVPKN